MRPSYDVYIAHSITTSMHDFVDSLKPNPGEVIIDKPGKGWEFNLVPYTVQTVTNDEFSIQGHSMRPNCIRYS